VRTAGEVSAQSRRGQILLRLDSCGDPAQRPEWPSGWRYRYHDDRDRTHGNDKSQLRRYPTRISRAGGNWGTECRWSVLAAARESYCKLVFWLFRASVRIDLRQIAESVFTRYLLPMIALPCRIIFMRFAARVKGSS
jgi:hypothetical protein